MLPLFWLAAKIILLAAGLLVPGSALMRALGVPRTIATCFAGSAVCLYATVLALQFFGVAIALGSMGSGLGLIAAATTIAGNRLRGRAALRQTVHGGEATTSLSPDPTAPFFRMGGWAPVYGLFWAAVLFRAWREPLAGPDVEFRWSFLAEQMLRHGSLDFYPPHSAGDFLRYFWAESIPPGVAALHAWAYACAGGIRPAWTVFAVVLQLWSLHELLWRVAYRTAGLSAARFACLAAAACPLLTWSVLIGQETGFTALSLVGIAFALQRWREARTMRYAGLAGLFAVLGAASREYGLVFTVVAAAGLRSAGANRRAWFAFLGFAIIGIAWPLRTWMLTGNPFYSLALDGLFPVNVRFVAWIEQDAEAFGAVLRSVSGWREIGRYLLMFAPTAVLGWLGLAVATAQVRRGAAFTLGAAVVVLLLWAASVRYTNGGLFYSMRVAAPAFALGTLAAGIGGARLASSRPRLAAAAQAALALGVAALLPNTLALPLNPWRTPWREWPAFAAPASAPIGADDETVALILKAIGSPSGTNARTPPTVVLADSPGYQRRFLPTGIGVVPLWSPQSDWLFDAGLEPATAARRWRESGVRFIVITKWKANLDFFNQHSRWSTPPFRVQLIGETSHTAVFAIRAEE